MLSPLFYKCVLHVGTREAGYMKMGPKIDEVWVLKSMIFVIFFDRFFGDFMFNFVSWPGRPDKRMGAHNTNTAQQSRAQHTTAQHNTAEQHNTAQQSTAEWSTAQSTAKQS